MPQPFQDRENNMSNRIQDLEQLILKDQNIIQDLDDLFEGICDTYLNNDQIANALMGIIQLYKIRHNKTWDCYTEVVREYYKFRKEAGYNQGSIVDLDTESPDLWSQDFTDRGVGSPAWNAAQAELDKKHAAVNPSPKSKKK